MRKNRIMSLIAAAVICMTNPAFAVFSNAVDEYPADAEIAEAVYPADQSACEMTVPVDEEEFEAACEYVNDVSVDVTESAAYPMDFFGEADSELTEAIHTILKYETGSEYGYADPSVYVDSDESHEECAVLAAPARETTLYLYNHLTPAQQKLWDDIDTACDLFDAKCKSTNQMNENKIFYFGSVKFDPNELTSDEAHQTLSCYFRSRPDRFYLTAYRLVNSITGELFLTATREHSSYNERAAAHEYIAKIRDKWLSQLDQFDTELEKETYLCTMVVDNVRYNNDCLTDDIEEQYKTINQVMGGSIFYGTGVCTSYAMALAYMCQAAGMEAVVVGSNSHAWIRVKLDGLWYETDPTFFDGVNFYTFKWANKSTKTFLENTTEETHKTNTYLTLPTVFDLPECVTDAEYPFKEPDVEKLTIDTYANRVRLRWPAIPGASNYKWKINNGGNDITRNWLVWSDLPYGEHTAIVTAYDSSGKEIYSSGSVPFVFEEDKPVTGVTAKVTGPYTGEISWDPVENATKYFVYKLHNGEYLRQYSTTDTTIFVGGLTPGVASTYAVKACYDTVESVIESSEFSKAVSITTPMPAYTISAEVSPNWLGNVSISKTTAYEGDKVTVTAPANVEGYIFKGWKMISCDAVLDSESALSATLTVGRSDVQLVAEYVPVTIETEPDFGDNTFILNFSKLNISCVAKYLIVVYADKDAYLDNKWSYGYNASDNKATCYNLTDGESYNIALIALDKNGKLRGKSRLYSFTKRQLIKTEGIAGETLVKLSWDALDNSKVAKYHMRGYSSPNNYFDEVHLGQSTMEPDKLSQVCGNLSPDNDYYFGIVAVDSDDNIIGKSNLVRLRTFDTTVKDITAVTEANKATLTWSKVKNANMYYVFRCDGDSYTFLGTTNTESFTRTGLADGSYTFAIKALVLGITSRNYGFVDFSIGSPSCFTERSRTPEGVSTKIYVTENGKYRWQKKSGTVWTDTGCTAASFTVSKPSDSGEYRCIITNSAGSETTASAVSVTVVPAADVTADMITVLDAAKCAEFVNAFSKTSDQAIILTEAQLLAISKVLEADY